MRYIDADKLKSEFDYKHIDMNKTTACVHHKNILEIINQLGMIAIQTFKK